MCSGRRLADPADPDPKTQPTRFPLHPTVTDAFSQIAGELQQGLAEGKSFLTIKPDRSAPAKFFKPEGSGFMMDPCTLENQFK